MTKEELKQEAIKASDKKCVKGCSKYYRYGFQNGYITGVESREKQIQIDAEQIRALQKQNGELTDKVKELEGQNEKMKCCHNCKNCAYAGFEIICKTYDCINQSKWEIKEK